MDSAVSSTEISPAASPRTVDMNAIFLRNQEQSPLLHLPAELRNTICKYALGGYEITIYKNEVGRLVVEMRVKAQRQCLDETARKNFQALNMACRQIRSESALLPLALNEFAALDVKGLLAFTNALTPEQRGAIRTVRITLYGTEEVRRLAAWDAAACDARTYYSLAATLHDVPNINVLTQQMLQHLPSLKSLHLRDIAAYGFLEKTYRATTTTPAGLHIKYTFMVPSGERVYLHHAPWGLAQMRETTI